MYQYNFQLLEKVNAFYSIKIYKKITNNKEHLKIPQLHFMSIKHKKIFFKKEIKFKIVFIQHNICHKISNKNLKSNKKCTPKYFFKENKFYFKLLVKINKKYNFCNLKNNIFMSSIFFFHLISLPR